MNGSQPEEARENEYVCVSEYVRKRNEKQNPSIHNQSKSSTYETAAALKQFTHSFVSISSNTHINSYTDST